MTFTGTKFRDAVDADSNNKRLGENSCLEYTDTGVGSDVLALSQLVREGDPTSLAEKILTSGIPDQVADLAVLVFVTRNARGGKGEKKLSYDLFLCLWRYFPQTAKKLIPLFPHYGYWKDLFLLCEMAAEEGCDGRNKSAGSEDVGMQREPLLPAVLDVIRGQFLKDILALERHKALLSSGTANVEEVRKKGPELSLLCKWLPRERSHFDKKTNFVDRFCETVWPSVGVDASTPNLQGQEDGVNTPWGSGTKRKYRKMLAEMTSYLELPEVLLSAKRYEEINFHKLASKATMKHTKAFLNEDKEGNQRSDDPKRIRLAERFLDNVVGKGAKGGQLMPHEIIREIQKTRNMTRQRELILDAQWKDLWAKVVEEVEKSANEVGIEFNPTRMVPLSDVSWSMHGTPMEVSIALGIGISEITHPAFRDMVMTFESKPRWHRLKSTDTIVEKVRSLEAAPWGGSTNFERAYDLILRVCEDHKLSREDMPTLIVFSDMQFNAASGSSRTGTMFQCIRKKANATAKSLKWTDTEPQPIVFWNLRSTSGHPVDKDTEGTVLLSGFSPSLLKLVMNGEALKEEEMEVVNADGTVTTEKLRVTPEQVLRKMLDDKLYDPVRAVLGESTEGTFQACEFSTEGEEGGEGFEIVNS